MNQRANAAASERALSRRLLPLAWALLALVGLLLGLTWGAMQIQLALAALLNGESVWSKAQKQLVIDLQAYAVSGDAENLAAFERNYKLLQYDRQARDEAAKADYDYAAAEEALRHDNAMREAVPVIIFALHHLPNAPYLRDALTAWRSTDDAITQLRDIAEELRQVRATRAWSDAEMMRQGARIAALNDYIQPRTNVFSNAIADGTKWLGRVLFGVLFFAGGLASLLWFSLARRILANVRGTEERYRLLFDSAADAIVMVDEDTGAIVDANRTAANWVGKPTREIIGARYSELFESGTIGDAATPAQDRLRALDGSLRSVETQSSLAKWGSAFVRQAIIRDVSERVAMEQERRIAAEALASIAEGVIIADAERRVVAVNAAHTLITGYEAETARTLRLGDLRTLPDGHPLPETIWQTIARDGNWIGEVKTRRRDGSHYIEQLSISVIRDDSGRVQHYVAVFTDISASKASQQRLEHLAAHDPLTGLLNRARFEEACDDAIRASERDRAATAVLFIDLDAFKIVNDSYSHAFGDRLLAEVAARITRQLGEGDVASRIGGDEFTVLVRRLRVREDAAALANRLLVVLSEPFVINDHEITLTASIGVAGYPLDGKDATALIGNADAAMYAAKTKQRNSIRFYTPMMHADMHSRVHLATELRQALARDEFRLMYQPCVELRTGRVVAVEALLRWHHPERGEIMPGDFIPVAETLGLIRHIDQWVMQAACKQLNAWDAAGVSPIRVALNVSASWFGHAAFVECLTRSVLALGLAPSRLLLEITEGSVLSMGEDTNRIMHALHALGVSVAIDDFGTGYSSLAYLKLPAVAYLKIDRSFVSGLPGNPNDIAIIQAMLAMSKSLGLRTIAEGIENDAQHEYLLREGCVEGQGFLYAMPLAPEEIARMLAPDPRRVKTKLQLVQPDRST